MRQHSAQPFVRVTGAPRRAASTHTPGRRRGEGRFAASFVAPDPPFVGRSSPPVRTLRRRPGRGPILRCESKPMREFYLPLFTIHIAAGVASLLTLVPPLVARKGGAWHRRVGMAFVAAMAVTAVSGLVIAGLWIAVPLAVKPPASPLSPDEAAARIALMRQFGCFLAYLGVLILQAVTSGLRAVAVGRRRAVHGALVDRAMAAFVLGTGAALTIAGIFHGSVLMIVFGLLGSRGGWQDLQYYRQPQTERRAWLLRHFDSMLGAVIAALTAFSVFNAERLFGAALPPGLAFLPWVLPTLIGVPAARAWRARYARGAS